jgi:hypothetical protein
MYYNPYERKSYNEIYQNLYHVFTEEIDIDDDDDFIDPYEDVGIIEVERRGKER